MLKSSPYRWVPSVTCPVVSLSGS